MLCQAVVLVATIPLTVQSAAACAMCLSFQSAQREAYFVTTLILLAVPLGIVGVFALWLYRAAARAKRGRPRLGVPGDVERRHPPVERGGA